MPDLSESLLKIAVLTVPFLLAVIGHEVAHGVAALAFGDPTARDAGRLTMNPVRHMDKAGTVVFVLTALFTPFVFGWAKPVPINPYRFRRFRAGLLVVSAAGAAANFLMAALALLAFRLLPRPEAAGLYAQYLFQPASNIIFYTILVNVFIGVFNLLPIPPLDGSNIVASLIPRTWAAHYLRIGRYGILLIFVLFYANVFDTIFNPVLHFLDSLLFQ